MAKPCQNPCGRTVNHRNFARNSVCSQDMGKFFFTSGQAARQLGTTTDAIRNLCQSGAIKSQTTAGGQWRVPVAEIERLKRDGLPPIPRPMPGRPAGPRVNSRASALLADPSEEAIAAADEVVRLESEIKALHFKRERE